MRAVKAAGDRKKVRPKVFRIKVISMGDTAVGTSCLIKRCWGWQLGVAFQTAWLQCCVCLIKRCLLGFGTWGWQCVGPSRIIAVVLRDVCLHACM